MLTHVLFVTSAARQVRLPHLDSNLAGAARQLVIGTGLGVVCTCFNTPFDVVKSRCGCYSLLIANICTVRHDAVVFTEQQIAHHRALYV
jgi:hypothetical protein